MQKVLTAAEMREVDRLTTERYGIPSIILMENAAHAVARVITEKLGGSVKGKSILILCGKGNNGGDGAALARLLSEAGAEVSVNVFGFSNDTKGDAKINFERIINHPQIKIDEFRPVVDDNGVSEWMDQSDYDVADVLVDAIFGTGLSRKLSEFYQTIINEILNTWKKEKGHPVFVSVDIPSGLLADSGERETCLNADLTVTFTAPKPANILPPAAYYNGELIVANIGSPQELIDEQSSQLYLTEKEDAVDWLLQTEFTDSSYKNKRGHALLIAGSNEFSGAAVLAGNAAIRSGVGLVTLATPHSAKDAVASRIEPEVMVRGIAETDKESVAESAFEELSDIVQKADSITIGCGLSQSESTKRFVEKVILNRNQPVIIDADALNLLSPFDGQRFSTTRSARSTAAVTHNRVEHSLILTPHEGEFLRLLGTDDKDSIKDRVSAVRDFSQKHNVILVLKGERVLIGEPSGKVVVNPTGNSGLGKAGNGDTLAGILGGFVTQSNAMNIDIFETVVAAVYIAGMAGDIAESKYGKRVMTASDVRECLAEAFQQLTITS